MNLVCETGVRQLIKNGETVCGDNVRIVRNPEETFVVLSDGLGSGIKANILSTLTATIISKMISNHVPLEDIVETVIGTLPVCSERHVAYATFTILQVIPDGTVHIIDFDGLPPIRINGSLIRSVERQPREIHGRQVNEATIQLKEGEYLFISSDGVTEAGLGLGLKMGLTTAGLMDALRKPVWHYKDAQGLANEIVDLCLSYYLGEAGDDTTGVAIRMRKPRYCAVLTGVPSNPADDGKMVGDFVAAEGRKIICGGTTAHVYARETGSTILENTGIADDDIPPTSEIDGVDLVTEGLVTLTRASDLLEKMPDNGNLHFEEENGATQLLEQLLWADEITVFCGMQHNPVYGDTNLGMDFRERILERLQENLQKAGKHVTIRQYA